MLHKTKQLLVILSALTLAGEISAHISLPYTDSDVSYSSVTSLEYRTPEQQLRYGEVPFQIGHLWLYELTNTPSKLIVFIRGACWLNQPQMAHTFPAATALAQTCSAVWPIEYSRTGDPGGGWPDDYKVIKAGIQWIGNLSEYGINGENIVIVGHSAGGHLALLAGINFPNDNTGVGLAAIADIVKYAAGTNDCETAAPLFMGSAFALTKESYRKATAVGLNFHCSTLLLHGTVDSIVNISQSVLPNATTSGLAEAGHFDWVHPGIKTSQTLLDSLEKLI